MHLQELLHKFLKCFEVYSAWTTRLCVIHLCWGSLKIKIFIQTHNINQCMLLISIVLIKSCSQNVVTYPQSLWQTSCGHGSAWSVELLLHWGTYHSEKWTECSWNWLLCAIGKSFPKFCHSAAYISTSCTVPQRLLLCWKATKDSCNVAEFFCIRLLCRSAPCLSPSKFTIVPLVIVWVRINPSEGNSEERF